MPLRVLARPSSNRKNPYTGLLYEQVSRAGHAVTEFSLARALLQKWDVVHVHWPESVFNHSLLEAIPTTEALLVALSAAKKRGAKLLWTVHNLRAHEKRHVKQETRFRERWLALLDGIVGLSHSGISAALEAYPVLGTVPSWVVPHPHYRGQYPDTLTRIEAKAALGIALERPTLVCLGRIFEYKNFDAVIRAVRDSEQAWTVVIAGEPRDSALVDLLRREAGEDARFVLQLGFVPGSDVQRYLRAADLVVQPYREILNSGTALLALSFDRPILMPARGAALELQQQVPAPWVQTYDGALNADVLALALTRVATLKERTDGSHLAAYSPEAAGRAQVRAFEELVRLERAPR